MVSFYYAYDFFPFIFDTVVYASFFVLLLNIVLNETMKKKHKFYARIFAIFFAAPIFTGFLFSVFGFDLGKIFSDKGVWVLGIIFALIFGSLIFKYVFKIKFSKLKGFAWLWWFLPVIIIPFAVWLLSGKIRDSIVFFAIFFLLFLLLFKMSKFEKLANKPSKSKSPSTPDKAKDTPAPEPKPEPKQDTKKIEDLIDKIVIQLTEIKNLSPTSINEFKKKILDGFKNVGTCIIDLKEKIENQNLNINLSNVIDVSSKAVVFIFDDKVNLAKKYNHNENFSEDELNLLMKTFKKNKSTFNNFLSNVCNDLKNIKKNI